MSFGLSLFAKWLAKKLAHPNFAGAKLAKLLAKWLAKWLAWRENAPGIGNFQKKKNTFTSLTYEFSLFGLAIPIEANDVAQCQIWKKQDNHTCQAKKAYTIK